VNHRAIVLKQYQDKAAKLRAELADTETAIRVLGGTVGNSVPSSPKRRSRGKQAPAAPRVRKPAPGAPVGPQLQAELDAIKANPKLSPIQKAQESWKARLAAAKGAQTPARPEGAVLSEAAAAS